MMPYRGPPCWLLAGNVCPTGISYTWATASLDAAGGRSAPPAAALSRSSPGLASPCMAGGSTKSMHSQRPRPNGSELTILTTLKRRCQWSGLTGTSGAALAGVPATMVSAAPTVVAAVGGGSDGTPDDASPAVGAPAAAGGSSAAPFSSVGDSWSAFLDTSSTSELRSSVWLSSRSSALSSPPSLLSREPCTVTLVI
ncbi:unnamed protein product [Ixodes persulcatus]